MTTSESAGQGRQRGVRVLAILGFAIAVLSTGSLAFSEWLSFLLLDRFHFCGRSGFSHWGCGAVHASPRRRNAEFRSNAIEPAPTLCATPQVAATHLRGHLNKLSDSHGLRLRGSGLLVIRFREDPVTRRIGDFATIAIE